MNPSTSSSVFPDFELSRSFSFLLARALCCFLPSIRRGANIPVWRFELRDGNCCREGIKHFPDFSVIGWRALCMRLRMSSVVKRISALKFEAMFSNPSKAGPIALRATVFYESHSSITEGFLMLVQSISRISVFLWQRDKARFIVMAYLKNCLITDSLQMLAESVLESGWGADKKGESW